MKRLLCTLAAAGALVPASARAQVAWDGPSMMRPSAPSGLSLLLMDADPGDGFGVMALYRGSRAPVGLGFRGGVVEGPGGDDVTAVFGVDVSGALADLEGAGDPSVLWWTGAGLGVGDDILVSFPLGIVLGWEARDEGVSFAPYAGAHVALDVFSGPGDDLDLEGVVDLGLDMTFDRNFMVRFGAALGGREALAIGVRLPSGR